MFMFMCSLHLMWRGQSFFARRGSFDAAAEQVCTGCSGDEPAAGRRVSE